MGCDLRQFDMMPELCLRHWDSLSHFGCIFGQINRQILNLNLILMLKWQMLLRMTTK